MRYVVGDEVPPHSRPVEQGQRTKVGPIIIGRAPAMASLLADLERVSHTEAKVLITGESGVGKELIAAYVHSHSRRASRPFIAVNCAGLPETLLESELFGHAKGSFTGAYRDKRGKFEVAHTGTLFLDELGEMTLRMQGLLLRVLESGELQKVGAEQPTARVDVRVIAATNRDLPSLIRLGHFREDLYYRLNVINVHVPPLRERREDIPMLAEYFLTSLRPDAGVPYSFSPDFFEAVSRYSWPGNVRELDNLVQRLAITSRTGVITAADLPREIKEAIAPSGSAAPRLERRRTIADVLYERLRAGAGFWETVYAPFMAREITRADVRGVVRKGLEASRGNYRIVTHLFNVRPGEYKRFLNFLRKHECLLPYRDYR